MTSSVISALNKIKELEVFKDELYFTGGTALSYFINHRISEDIDIVSPKILDYRKIIPIITSIGAKKVDDENIMSLRLAGLFPDEYILKFVLDDVKIEFFFANRPIQKDILKELTYTNFENSNLKILDLKSIIKLKLVALFQRDKARDLFDFGSILEKNIISIDEILFVAKESKNINSKEDLINFISNKQESRNDEAVYLSESNRLDLSFEDIKQNVLNKLKTN
ncbi:MAG: nucleotidyl transferase AbiEii/AbiGii toxin family protein [Arcobacter sp.]|jgi:predicted nucleotidyltransferase component of viral defense system|uniref:nucleotidyl transferase AbiEii/AbiGii toxin family protein n=1 Tax=Arcobacter sp. TaxID=1872629 RepID=UPI002A75F042|nr:nucleotidyl transferase AbiEii/AbiGii toxin family protein [Arcobacter sp.]MDY3205054.1 nucleotidyl transferase AbiEii/AbiGii toxin family protein [Arcobacter sp.]